jgi:hypothetical protein
MGQCRTCNGPHATDRHREVSEGDASLDSLVEANSQPSLATLFRAAKDRGLVTAGWQYESTSN